MELEDIRKKYQCDEGRTFAQWKEWVRKNKPSQAETHIVTAVAPNGSKFEKLIGGYTDAQNNAFDLVAHGYKKVKMFKSVNAGPLKLLRNFSAPLHGAKFKDSVDSTLEKYANDASLSQKKDQPVKVTNISIKPSPVGGFEGNVYYSKNGETDLYSPWHIMANGKWGFPFGRSSTRLTQSDKKLIEQKIKKLVSQKGVKVKDSVDSVDSIRQKYQCDAWNHLDREMKRKIISHLKTRWKFSDAIINRFIRDFDGDFSMFIKEKMSWPEITKFLDTRAKKVDVNPYSSSYRHSLLVEKGKMKQPGNKFDKLGSGKNPLKIDSADGVEQIRAKYSTDAMVPKSELDKKKYTQFFVNGEDINGKVLRIPQRRFKKFEEAVRVAKSLQNANTRHVFVEGGWDNNQFEPKALYDWRNPKAK